MKRKKELIVILSSLLVIVLSVSVAYFTTKILGTGKEISVESADLKVIFTSGSGTINGTNIEPGWTSGENTFTVKNESNGTYKYNIIIKDLVNTFVTEGFLQYKITSTDGGYNMTEFVDVPKSSSARDTVLAFNISIDKGATHTYTIEIKYLESAEIDQSEDMGKTLTGKIFIEDKFKGGTLSEAIQYYNPTISTRTNFSTPFTTNTANTLYKATENATDVYYFAGQDTESTPINNWVKFGKTNKNECTYNGSTVLYFDGTNLSTIESESQCLSSKICKLGNQYGVGETVTEDFCTSRGAEWTNQNAKWGTSTHNFYWRIIRTNSDGSIRLLYSGKSTTTADACIGTSAFNTSETESPKYVGYMYGNTDATLEEARANTNDSTIKTYIDNWYNNNLSSYTKYISTEAVYCNDRELASGATYSATGSEFAYAAYTRLDTNKTPTYDCTNNNDKFTVDASAGNGKLKYPIALMTADEIAYAGGVFKTNAPMWYYTNSSFESSTGIIEWWSLSPGSWNGFNTTFSLYVDGSDYPGRLNYNLVRGSLGVRPAVSLKSCVQWKSGNGSADNPYEIVENGGC